MANSRVRSRASRAIAACLIALVFFAGICFGSVSGEGRRPKNVQASLRAKWAGTPLLLEAGELLSKEWNDVFWEFIERWKDMNKGSDCLTAKCCVEKIVEDSRSLLTENLGSIFELSLTLRMASPRLVLYRQLAEESLYSFSTDDIETEQVMNQHGQDYARKAASPSFHDRTCCWVVTGSQLLYTATDLLHWLEHQDKSLTSSALEPAPFDFDHVYPGSSAGAPIVVLYGAVGTNCFKGFHDILTEASTKGKVKYVLRPVFLSGCQTTSSFCSAVGFIDAVTLSGYGVELALKNMEYKAMDDSAVKTGVAPEDPRTEDLTQEVRGFIFSKILERKPEISFEIMAFRDYLLSTTVSDTLEIWQLKDLGHQTVQRIVHAADPLQSMQEINENFPSVVSSLSRMKLDNSIKDEIIANQRMVPPGKSLMALNGALVNVEDADLFLLLDSVHKDLSLSDQFTKIKLPQSTTRKILSSAPPESLALRVDYRSSHVHYLNNLEEDAMYRRWRSNINEILMPVFPGQLHHIRKNMFHAVYVLDPDTPCGAETIDMIVSLYQESVPMRFGVILYSTRFISNLQGSDCNPVKEDTSTSGSDVSSLIIKLFLYIKETYTAPLAFSFLSNVNKVRNDVDSSEYALEAHHVEGAFVHSLTSQAKSPPQDVLLELEKESKYKNEATKSSYFVYKLGLYKLQCCLLMNGLVHESSEESTMSAMQEELSKIQQQVYYGQINSHTNILEKFLDESGYKRYNPLITGDSKEKKFFSLIASFVEKESILHGISYLHSPGTMDDVKAITHLLVIDVSLSKSFRLLCEGIRYLMAGSNRARVGVLFYSTSDAPLPLLLFKEIFDRTAHAFSNKEKVFDFLLGLYSYYEDLQVSTPPINAVNINEIMKKVYELAEENDLPTSDYHTISKSFSSEAVLKDMNKVSNFLFGQLRLQHGSTAVITNGRIYTLDDKASFISDDLVLLENLEYNQRAKHIFEIIEEAEWTSIDPDDLTSKFYSDLSMLVSSAMAVRERGPERAHFEILNAQHSAIILKNDNSSIHIDAVIDPLSPVGQKLAPLLRVLWEKVKPSMRIVLNPISSLVDIPLKNYYRFVLPSMDDFSSVDNLVHGPKAFFANMPLSKTLTMNIDVPEPWLVEPVIAVHDLDNILLENLGDVKTLQAVFELEALLLTGHCMEKDHEPPRGLQFILGTKKRPHLVDTLVMANLGYFQIKVSPGVWFLQLAPGRSSELYMLSESGNWEQAYPYAKMVAIDSLRGKLIHIEVQKKRGKEHEDLLNASDESQHEEAMENENGWNNHILRWASGFIGGAGFSGKQGEKKLDPKSGRHGETINIFSVASGHLYERFLKIMFLSVLKNTQRPVKFWLIKNYLSPTFKDVIPHMAQEYGFDYELITYKWPTWLHKQKEKQRIIWAYKILFLDVIFPLSLKKVIFVDADQIVRADMGELYDMNLKGRPLAYTPFCDNNKDMDGYRFWKQGFWRDHLRGKPYHISALYVVDLLKFRQTAAGDNLRVFYETLSKDPNSLSNLDQDLPNYAQHNVPIFSLPQEWLWCESWCGNATKAKAKTIDLCNNPMTKEPKLQAARRIVTEWVDLDSEARKFSARILGEQEQAEPPVITPSSPVTAPSAEPDHKTEKDSKDEL